MDPHLKELEQNKHKLELIKMARELLNEEYINRRAQDHNKWLAESDIMWRTKRIKLPYPAFASYPTDEEIVAKASILYKFVNEPQTNTVAPTQVPVLTTAEMATALKLSPSQSVTADSPWKTYLTPDTTDETARGNLTEVNDTANISESATETPVPATLDTTASATNVSDQSQINQSVSGLQSLLPGWVRRSQGT